MWVTRQSMAGILLAALATTAALAAAAACTGEDNAIENQFAQAIDLYLAKKGALCLGIDNNLPMTVSDADARSAPSNPTGVASQMAALASVKLVAAADTETRSARAGTATRGRRYAITEVGARYYRTVPGDHAKGEFCYGRRSVARVVRWSERQQGDAREVRVIYVEKVDDLADWAQQTPILDAFPYVEALLARIGRRTRSHNVRMTTDGWVAEGLDGEQG